MTDRHPSRRPLRERFHRVVTTIDGAAERAHEEFPSIRKKWLRRFRKTRFGKHIWPAIRREAEIVLKVTGVIFVSIWAKRLVEQLFGAKLLNESVMRGSVNEIIRDVEQDVDMEGRK